MKKWDYKIKIDDTFCEWEYQIETKSNEFSIEDIIHLINKKLKGKIIKTKNTKKYKSTMELFNKA